MIQIEIDKKNIEFRDFHVSKIKVDIENSLIKKRNIHKKTDFEYQVLDWIHRNLKLILLSKVEKLRNTRDDFNSLLEGYNNVTYLNQINNIKKYEYEKEKKEVLINLLESSSIVYQKGKKKEEYLNLVWKNKASIKIDNVFKYRILKNRINKIIKNIFIDFYEKRWDEIKDYDRYTFVTKHELKTCPYCNMGYILISQKDEKGENGLRPDIDHFFPKSKYPYLAMSFYNLIPCCKVCNYSKGSKDTVEDGLLSPYEINSSTFKLTYTPKNMNFLQIKKKKYNFNSFDIKFKKIDEHSNEYFKLDKLYEQHKDIVLELLIKRTIYSKSYTEELKRNFHFTDDEIYRFLFCNYKESDEFNKRPLSKLINDIIDELGFKRVGLK